MYFSPKSAWGLAAVLGVATAGACPAFAQSEVGSGTAQAEAPAPSPATPAEAAPAEASPRPAIEEIIVTAQKKEEALQDVPISMSVLGNDFLNEEGITDFETLSQYVPNLDVQNQGYRSNVGLRGFATPATNKVFEPTVGLAVDDVPLGRREFFNASLFDLERIEVLRGPQGTLFGKNTTAGLIHLVPAKPTDELTGFADVELGELDRRRVEAAIGGPIVGNLVTFRLSGLLDERDGIVRNTTDALVPGALERLGERDGKALRAQIGLPNLLGANVNLLYERSELEVLGNSFEIVRSTEGIRTFMRQFDPNTDFEKGNFIASSDQSSFIRRDVQRFAASASYDLGGWVLNGIAGHAFLETDDLLDGDLSPANVISFASKDDNPETTGEARVTSPTLTGFLGLDRLFGFGLGDSDFTAGFFYGRRNVEDSELTLDLDTYLSGQVRAFNGANPPTAVAGGGAPPDETDQTTNFFEQDSESIAGFGQLNWRPIDRGTLTYGMRFTHEEKSATWNRVFDEPGVLLPAGGFEEFTASDSRSESGFTPRVAARYDVTDDLNVFASWSKGFKGGTFNEFRRNLEERPDVDTEKTTAWEVGTKSNLWEGLLQLNLALYWQDVTDLQTFAIRGGTVTSTTEVANAGEARSRGVEADYSWLPLSWLTIRGALAFTDTEFLEFEDGGCFSDRQNADGDENPGCDLSGGPLGSTPKWMHVVTPSVRFPLGSLSPLEALLGALDLTGSLTVEWQDTQLESDNLDSRSRQDSYFKLDGSIGLESLDRGWSLRIVGENLTDQVIGINFQEVLQAAGNFSHDLYPPRLFFGEFRWGF